MRRILVSLGAPVAETPVWREAVAAHRDLILAADGGAEILLKNGLVPHAVYGDFDSLSPERLEELKRREVPLYRHPAAKDETDAELVLHAVDWQEGDRVLLSGALSQSRPDHQAGNFALARELREKNITVCLTDGQRFVFLLRGPESFWYDWKRGEILQPELRPDLVSALCPWGRVEGLSYEGLAYPLHEVSLERSSVIGLSNRPAENATGFRVSLRSGLLDLYLLFETGSESTPLPDEAFFERQRGRK